MAHLIRMARPCSDWTTNELLAYNITVQRQDVMSFFDDELGPIDHLDSNLLSSADPTIGVDLSFSKETYRFLTYLDLASRASLGQESAIRDLAKSILEVTGFDDIGTILRTRYDIPLTSGYGTSRPIRSDVCLVHINSMILLVQVNQLAYAGDPEPQIIAEAIATFQHNNRRRVDLGLPPLDTMTIPCITLVGTRPCFYLIPVTQHLSDCVTSCRFPFQPTVVKRCAPPARRRASEGMEIPEYRRIALQYYDTFRDVAKECWAAYLEGCD